MHDSKYVDIGRRGQRIDDQKRKPSHLELSRIRKFACMAEQRELGKHHHCLTNSRNDPVRCPFVVCRNPVINRTKVIACL